MSVFLFSSRLCSSCFAVAYVFWCQFECGSASPLHLCAPLQAGQVQNPADLSDSVCDIRGAGVCLPIPVSLHRHAFLPGGCECWGLSYSVYHP